MWRRCLIGAFVLIVIFIVVVVLISFLLGKDDLADCSGPIKNSGHCQSADAIVAVSGGDTAARAQKAIEMYQAGWAKKLIFSGDSADPTAKSNAAVMKELAIEAGVPSDDIVIEEKSRDTKENAANTIEILHQLDVDKVILVSSPYHLRRVKMNFETQDKRVNFRTVAANDSGWKYWFLSPRGWSIALVEIAGIIELSLGTN